MAGLDDTKNSLELNNTSRKRKRNFEEEYDTKATPSTTSCFTNAAFSSTPKHSLAKRRIQFKKNHENRPIFLDSGLEVVPKVETNIIPQNPYEVLRKPPKKKKRHNKEEISCFENPALNLEIPEKLFNPYEVIREITPNKSAKCFSNPALNLKVEDASVLCNPFEVQRVPSIRYKDKIDGNSGLKNPFEISPEIPMQQGAFTLEPCKFKLGLPFVPTIGCRIEFNDISISQITPSKLLAEKLVFSPETKTKVVLSPVGEETTMDIGKELDRYQLELENSINEAKLRKTSVPKQDLFLSPQKTNLKNQKIDTEKKLKFTQKLGGISEDVENEQIIEETAEHKVRRAGVNVPEEINQEKIITNTNPFRFDVNKQLQSTETATVVEIEDLDELNDCSALDQDEDSFDLKDPSPFIRAYTKPVAQDAKLQVSKESIEHKKIDNSGKLDDHIKNSLNVKNIIRKSIRRLMHNQHDGQLKQSKTENIEYEKNTLVNFVRQSLRLKSARNVDEKLVTKESEMSIIDGTERTIKLKSDVLQTEYIKIEDLTNERKHNLRNSIRKSTREVRNQFLKSVFHKKHEEYHLNT